MPPAHARRGKVAHHAIHTWQRYCDSRRCITYKARASHSEAPTVRGAGCDGFAGPAQIERTMKLAVRPQGGALFRGRPCTAAHPLHTVLASISGASISEAAVAAGPQVQLQGAAESSPACSRAPPAPAPRTPAPGLASRGAGPPFKCQSPPSVPRDTHDCSWYRARSDGCRRLTTGPARPPGPGLARRAAGEGGGAWAQTRPFQTLPHLPPPALRFAWRCTR